jgi:hypothetical protein
MGLDEYLGQAIGFGHQGGNRRHIYNNILAI